MEEIIYFEIDNWFAGRDYPNAQPFLDWMNDDNLIFTDNDWCIDNHLCVEATIIDMSVCFCITAPRSWVEENCPKLLTDEECGSISIISYYDANIGTRFDEKKYENCSYSKFICKPDENGEVYGRISNLHFKEYKEENFGVHWNDEEYYEDEDEENDNN